MNRFGTIAVSGLAALTLGGCGEPSGRSVTTVQSDDSATLVGVARGNDRLLPLDPEILELRDPANPQRNAYFGDLHVHTANSFDAYQFGTIASARDAYRYAKGEALRHPSGYEMRLLVPLDFYAVTDHAMFMGVSQAAADTNSAISQLAISKPLHNLNAPDNMSEMSLISRGEAFSYFIPDLLAAILDGSVDQTLADDVSKAAWRGNIDAAEEANVEGSFTSFIGYEYTTSSADRGNLHRNVIFKGSDRIPVLPFSRINSTNPEDLWDWMDQLRAQGIESLAIPHNSNGSNGKMFMREDWAGTPIDNAYAEQRLRNEPLVEITQVKGTSDTHPALSKNDEWANFEIVPYRVATKLFSEPQGSYVRDAYLRGLELSGRGIGNPYLFGLIGSSDTHTGATSDREYDYHSKAGLIDGTAELRGSIPLPKLYGAALRWYDPGMVSEVEGNDYLETSSFELWSASGLAGVWAEENTREAIYAALRRKETFATSGPRIKLRFFAGLDYPQDLLEQANGVATAYAEGVTMGASLERDAQREPQFLVWAVADANSAPLQRVQIIKGTVIDGEHREQVYDVACSDGAVVDPTTYRCPDNGAQVDMSNCDISAEVGDAEIKTAWRDPQFDPAEEAFYYVRVLENPTCRWSTWDALREGSEPRSDLPPTIQERAWSSPIWVRPNTL